MVRRPLLRYDADTSIALFDYFCRWVFVLALTAVDALVLVVRHIAVEPTSLHNVIITLSAILIPGLLFWPMSRLSPRTEFAFSAAADMFCSIVQAGFIILAVGTLTYITASMDFPLSDALLARADAALGFDWEQFNEWVHGHPIIATSLWYAYESFLPQFFLAILINSVRKDFAANGELLWNFMITAFITTLVSGIVPALGQDGMIGHKHIAMLEQVRNGNWIALGPKNVSGLVTFPSFHAAVAVIMAYWSRFSWRTVAVFVPLNIAMLISTPPCGGHYLVDTLAGILVAAISVFLVRRIQLFMRTQAVRQPVLVAD